MLLEANSSLTGDSKWMAEPPGSQTVHIIMRLYETIMRLEGIEKTEMNTYIRAKPINEQPQDVKTLLSHKNWSWMF